MGSVWCAYDSVLSRKVAVKVLAPQFQYDVRALRRFAREARAAARLSGHRNITTIYDSGPAFIVMEHVTGGTVADALRTGEISAETARRWIHDAATALDYAHRRGVVHGDIKPGNLLLDSARAVRIADFGIARIATDQELTSTGQLFGTVAYLSPEQALGARATDASDRYALAVVAFELLTGEKPFRAEGLLGTARRHVEAEPPAASRRNPSLPRGLDAVLQRGMAKRPEERWPTALAFANAIDAALDGRSVSLTRRAPLAANKPRAAALAAFAAAALVAGAALGASDHQSGPHKRVVASAARHPAAQPQPQPQPAAAKPTKNVPPARPKPTSTATPSAPANHAAPPASAASLEARGHTMMLAGNYPAAIPLLQRAMQSAPAGSLLYQWSLFDLGHSYREMGDLRAAIPLLQERLRFPEERGVVEQELAGALSAYGHAQSGKHAHPTGAPPGKQNHGLLAQGD